MKKTILSLVFALICLVAQAQVPQSIAYQAIAKNGAGNTIISSPVGIRVSILNGSATGTAVYVETHTPTTNNAGLFVLSLGLGTATTGTFTAIDWATGTKFLKIDMDATGGTNYTTVGTTQLLSVPYALYADKVNPANLPAPTPQNLSISGNSLSISGGNSVTLPASTDAQTLTLTGNTLSISGGNNVTLPAGGVPKVTNAQMFSLPNPQLGDVVFNTSIRGICFYDGAWKHSQSNNTLNVINSPNATNINVFSNINISTPGSNNRYFSFADGTIFASVPTCINSIFKFGISSYLQISLCDGQIGFFKESALSSSDFSNANVDTINNLNINITGSDYIYTPSPIGKVYEFTNMEGKKGLLLINSYTYDSGTNIRTLNISVKVQQ